MSDSEWDVCVIGGGPGGATAATLMRMHGHKVLLLEKDQFPIYKIGESLLPATIHGVCSLLGVTKEIENAGFVRKLGGTFQWGRCREPWTFSFSESESFAGPTSYAYQVERLKFDTILIENARRNGVVVRDRHRVVNVLETGDRVTGLSVVNAEGERQEVRCRYVVDASGHGSATARYCGERIYSPFFRNIAVFGYYRNGKRLPPPRAGNIFCVAFSRGWFWYIPLSATLTSVGAVIGNEHAPLLHDDGTDAALTSLIAECQPIAELLADAARVTDGPYGQVRVRKDYSYIHTSFWRPGLVLVGDAACFIDPVFSSGVHLATYSALLAARSVNSYLAGTLDERRVFTEFEARYRREYGYFHDFLTAFYDMNQDPDSYFWTARKVLRAEGSAREAFVRLVGGGAGDDAPSGAVDGVERAGLAIGRRMTGEPSAVPGDPAAGARSGAEFWSELNAEGQRIQIRAALRSAKLDEKPLFDNGLVPSASSLEWVQPRPTPHTRHALSPR